MLLTLFQLIPLALFASYANGQNIIYPSAFVDPDYVLAKNYGNHTLAAQQTIASWANLLAARGPWSVTNKTMVPPSGTKHDFISLAPYWWPECNGVGNTTALTEEQIWEQCPYRQRDGIFNPDVRTLTNNIGDFQDMSQAVFYNVLAWAFSADDKKAAYEENAVRFLRVWFIDEATRMNPNLNFGQRLRGPGGRPGSPTGILDLKGMIEITSAVMILRKGSSTLWTKTLDDQLIAWTQEYIRWLESAEIANDECNAANNHGSFCLGQLASLKLIINDIPGSTNVTGTFFNRTFKAQIIASGEQPFESARTRSYHYCAYNVAAMVSNARIHAYSDPTSKPFEYTTNAGTTIKSALDYCQALNPAATNEEDYANEIYPYVAAIASVHGDPTKKYIDFLRKADPTFLAQPYIFINQPFAVGEKIDPSLLNSGATATDRVKPNTTLVSRPGFNEASSTHGGVSVLMYTPVILLFSWLFF